MNRFKDSLPYCFLLCIAGTLLIAGYPGSLAPPSTVSCAEPVDAPLKWDRYTYVATVLSVYDADTITVDIDLGLKVRVTHKLRLYGINAWEVTGSEKPQGRAARDWMRRQIPVGKPCYIRTIRDRTGKYGRTLAIVYTADGVNLNQKLVELGHARYQTY